MYYSETKVIMGGLAHVPILIFIVNFVKGKFESIASEIVEFKKEEPKVKVVEVKEEEVKEEEVKRRSKRRVEQIRVRKVSKIGVLSPLIVRSKKVQ